jgi:predicted GNAT family acetyltransferase
VNQGNEVDSVRNNPELGRFEIEVDGHMCVAEYELGPDGIAFTHTVVPSELGGRGLGTQLVEAGLAHARSQQLPVKPHCAFFARYMQRHPETHDLIHPEHRGAIGL